MREEQLTAQEKKYIEIQYDAVTQGYLRQYCLDNDFDLTYKFNGKRQDVEDFDFHSTVIFSTSRHDFDNETVPTDITATATGFALFGENQDILVLEIESEDLVAVRDYYVSTYDMTDEWPDYKPHITVCYQYKGELPDVDLPDIDLTADKINVKRQK